MCIRALVPGNLRRFMQKHKNEPRVVESGLEAAPSDPCVVRPLVARLTLVHCLAMAASGRRDDGVMRTPRGATIDLPAGDFASWSPAAWRLPQMG